MHKAPLKNRLAQKALRFAANTQGNIAMTTGVAMMAIVIAAGAAIDTSKLMSDKARGQIVADSAALQATLEFKTSQRLNRATWRATTMGEENLTIQQRQDGTHTINTTVTRPDSRTYVFTTTVTGVTKHSVMGLIGNNETTWTTTAESQFILENAEIAVVLDISASMQFDGKLEAMKLAAKDFVQNLEPYENRTSYLSISLIPFAENVNFGQDLTEGWLSYSDRTNPEFSDDFYGCFHHSTPDTIGNLRSANYYSVTRDPYVISSTVTQTEYHSCPAESAKAMLFDTRENLLMRNIDDMEMGFGTGTGVAMEWAERTFDPAWRNQMVINGEEPPALTASTKKYIVLLTDGRVTHVDEDQNGVMDGKPDGVTLPLPAQTPLEKFNAACEKIKAHGDINVYAIGYAVTGTVSAELETALSNCVTGSGQFFETGTEDLSQIFSEIQADIQQISLTR